MLLSYDEKFYFGISYATFEILLQIRNFINHVIAVRIMNNINQRDIIDTKIVNNTTYNLVLCQENGMKLKLWIPEYLMTKAKPDERKDIPPPVEKNIITLEDKVNQIYCQLSKATAEEMLDVQKQVSKIS